MAGCVVIITGASGRSRSATALEVVSRGFDVALVARGEAGLEAAAGNVRLRGSSAVLELLRTAGLDPELLDAACCGLAGNFRVEGTIITTHPSCVRNACRFRRCRKHRDRRCAAAVNADLAAGDDWLPPRLLPSLSCARRVQAMSCRPTCRAAQASSSGCVWRRSPRRTGWGSRRTAPPALHADPASAVANLRDHVRADHLLLRGVFVSTDRALIPDLTRWEHGLGVDDDAADRYRIT